MNADKHELKRKDSDLFDRIIAILEQARSNVVRAVNSNTVVAYWLIGREIVQDLQQGEQRAEYGERVIEDLSSRLIKRYGRGFSVPNIRNFRQFYVMFQDRKPEIHYPSGSELPAGQKRYLAGSELSDSGQSSPWYQYMGQTMNTARHNRLQRTMVRVAVRSCGVGPR